MTKKSLKTTSPVSAKAALQKVPSRTTTAPLSALVDGYTAYSGERDRSFRSIVTAAHEMVLRG